MDFRKQNKDLLVVTHIGADTPHYTMKIHNVKPDIKLKKIYYCDIIFEETYDAHVLMAGIRTERQARLHYARSAVALLS